MEIEVTNFGPVKKATLNITPITVIIGENNKGKSFLSQLIFAIVSTFRGVARSTYNQGFRTISLDDITSEYFVDWANNEEEIKRYFKSFVKSEIKRDELIPMVVDYSSVYFAQWFDRLFKDNLERIFGVHSKDLVSFGRSKSTIFIQVTPISKLIITIKKNGSISSRLELNSKEYLESAFSNKDILPSIESARTARFRKKQLKAIIEIIKPALHITPEIGYPYYLPAGRGGLIDSWETISSALINLAATAIPRGLYMPPIPGTSAMFYNILQSLTGRHTKEFASVCEKFQDIFDGDVVVAIDGDIKGKRKIQYSFTAGAETRFIDIIHASSMIKELGPLYLIIKGALRKRDIFIVEEPESHLHPKAQRDFIEIVVKLAEQGVISLFTTHSDILLRTLVHAVYKSSRSNTTETLSMDALSIYLIKGGTTGSVVQKVTMGPKGSLDELPSFDEVMEELYDEELRLSIL